MTLGRLALAWLPVALWFLGVDWVVHRNSTPPVRPNYRLPIEAALLTLFASLWFDSLGSGGWWLLFLLVGALATIPTWLPEHRRDASRRTRLIGACVDVARYQIAGALLAWSLG